MVSLWVVFQKCHMFSEQNYESTYIHHNIYKQPNIKTYFSYVNDISFYLKAHTVIVASSYNLTILT